MIRRWPLALVCPSLLFGLLGVPAWAAAQPQIDAPSFTVSPSALNFGSIPVGGVSRRQYVTVTNVSGSTVTVSGTGGGAGVFGGVGDCQGKVLPTGRSCHFFYQFRPDALGPVQVETNGTLNGQPYALTFTGTGLPGDRIRFTNNPVAAGTDLVPFSFQVDTLSVPASTLSATGPLPAGLTFVDEGNGTALIAGTPTVTGSFAIRVRARIPGKTHSKEVHITLAPAQFSISPTTINFGSVPVGTTSPTQTVTVTNISGTTVLVFGTGGGATIFGGTGNCQGKLLAAEASCQYFYAFSPVTKGFVQGGTSGTLDGQPYALTFTGTGT